MFSNHIFLRHYHNSVTTHVNLFYYQVFLRYAQAKATTATALNFTYFSGGVPPSILPSLTVGNHAAILYVYSRGYLFFKYVFFRHCLVSVTKRANFFSSCNLLRNSHG